MPKIFTSKTQKIGEIGENIAIKFLVKHGFSIKERNYTKKWGEIDIIAEKQGKLYFIEVKSVSRITLETLPQHSPEKRGSPLSFQEKTGDEVIRETSDDYRPEDNMHPWKLKRMARTIQTYMLSDRIPEDIEWQVDLLVIYLDLENKKAKVKVIDDIVL